VSYEQIIARREECTRKARNALLAFFGVCALGLAYVTASVVHEAQAMTALQTQAAAQSPTHR
jgi:thiol:disulfide interchange protein